MKALPNYGCALSPKHVCHQALVKMSEFLSISWGFLIPDLKQAMGRGVILGHWDSTAL